MRTLEIDMNRPLLTAATVLAHPDFWSPAHYEFAFRTHVGEGLRLRFADLHDVRVFAAEVRRFAAQCRLADDCFFEPAPRTASPATRSRGFSRPSPTANGHATRPTPLSFGS